MSQIWKVNTEGNLVSEQNSSFKFASSPSLDPQQTSKSISATINSSECENGQKDIFDRSTTLCQPFSGNSSFLQILCAGNKFKLIHRNRKLIR